MVLGQWTHASESEEGELHPPIGYKGHYNGPTWSPEALVTYLQVTSSSRFLIQKLMKPH